jgi:hypothetical protein
MSIAAVVLSIDVDTSAVGERNRSAADGPDGDATLALIAASGDPRAGVRAPALDVGLGLDSTTAAALVVGAPRTGDSAALCGLADSHPGAGVDAHA